MFDFTGSTDIGLESVRRFFSRFLKYSLSSFIMFDFEVLLILVLLSLSLANSAFLKTFSSWLAFFLFAWFIMTMDFFHEDFS